MRGRLQARGRWADEGLRVLLFAGRPETLAFGEPGRPPQLPSGLVPLGLVALSDELRPHVRETLDEFAAAGIELKIISGDNPHTVDSLARQAGLRPPASAHDLYCESLTGDAAGARGASSESAIRESQGEAAADDRETTSPPSPDPSSSSSSRPRSPTRPSGPRSSAASRPSRSRSSSTRCATAATTWP